ncbi:hypothetical protein ASG25_12285 [Rhizobium sp. Leaf384]|uniref:DUF924 family protein n=1 Tax=unclassified Rhizobium TaxID=2613769 RepID=UPI000712A3FA|nr:MULTISPECIES: DUF924 family protein [unclassified Rhizobium]KQR68902.1 hypothetical protein ASG03_06585 [Rhizobium sp. Leaf341]KQS79319.1 hypothetical protein ASG25_12285 [Rhizobium sp. Leaf384]KQS82887.1 hypothetical protein ASG58_06100 [Rhizobium sp. Leaf383]
MSDILCEPREVLAFWFEDVDPEHWYKAHPALDAECDRRFRASHLALSRDVAPAWRATPDGRLAAVILFDQMSRNIYRASPLAFATDGLARREARLALEAGADQAVEPVRRAFFYLPFEHSEAMPDQDLAVQLFTALGDPVLLDFAVRHREIVARFGRFPHRNAILGRMPSPQEEAFLLQPGSRF